MGMASYGDASRIDLDGIVSSKNGDLRIDTDYVWTPREKRWDPHKPFGKKLVERFGPPREGDDIDEPYIHIAAAVQKRLEDATLELVDYHLKPVLEKTPPPLLRGGCALNVVLNRKLMAHPLVDELWVQPGAGDSGLSLGAASYAARSPGREDQAPEARVPRPALDDRRGGEGARLAEDPLRAARGCPREGGRAPREGRGRRLVPGPHGVGPASAREPLDPRPPRASEGRRTTSTRASSTRERWRPFCPSVLEERAPEVLGNKHPSPFMTHSFTVNPAWKERIAEVVHVDGTARPQVVSKETNPRFHRLISEFERRTGLPCVINTSLNRSRRADRHDAQGRARDCSTGAASSSSSWTTFLVTKRRA